MAGWTARLRGVLERMRVLAPVAPVQPEPEPAPHDDPSPLPSVDAAPSAASRFVDDRPPPLTGSPESIQLQRAIAEEPLDAGPQLVLADLLLADEDPRGELIVLHHRETTDGLTDPEALERYLWLAAHYGFPRAEPDDPPLPFVAAGPARYVLGHDGRNYAVSYAANALHIGIDHQGVLQRRLKLASRNTWTPDEAAVILRLVGDAIRARTSFQGLQFPFGADPLPSYDGGPLRCYRLPTEFTRPRGIAPNQLGLAARDYGRWIVLWRRLAKTRADSR